MWGKIVTWKGKLDLEALTIVLWSSPSSLWDSCSWLLVKTTTKLAGLREGCYSALSFNTRSFPHLPMTPHIGRPLILKELTFGFFPLSTVKIMDEKMDWSRTQCSQGPCLDGGVGLPTDWLLLDRCPSSRNSVVPHKFVTWNKSF